MITHNSFKKPLGQDPNEQEEIDYWLTIPQLKFLREAAFILVWMALGAGLILPHSYSLYLPWGMNRPEIWALDFLWDDPERFVFFLPFFAIMAIVLIFGNRKFNGLFWVIGLVTAGYYWWQIQPYMLFPMPDYMPELGALGIWAVLPCYSVYFALSYRVRQRVRRSFS